jgi:RNA polymerase sigma factor (TIGR02999 family)
MSDVSRIMSRIDSGDPSAADQLLPLVYEELRNLAAAKLAQEMPGQTLQATALVHEAYLRLVGQESEVRSRESGPSGTAAESQLPTDDTQLPMPDSRPPTPWHSRGHFFAAAAEAMRRILVEQARRKHRVRHGGEFKRVELDSSVQVTHQADEHLLALDEALQQLATEDLDAAAVVKLRYFAGLTIEQAAMALDISVRTANRHWAFARAWLYEQLK